MPASEALEQLDAIATNTTWPDEHDGRVSFSLPNAPESSLTIEDGQVTAYTIRPQVYPADEYGLILLRRALEYVADQHDLFPASEQAIEAADETYAPAFVATNCSRPFAAVVDDVTTLVDAYDTIDERSRLS